MPDKTIDSLPSGIPAQAGDLIPISRTPYTTNYSVSAQSIANLAPPLPSPSSNFVKRIYSTARSAATVYQNTTGYDLLVFACVSGSGGALLWTAYVSSNSTPSTPGSGSGGGSPIVNLWQNGSNALPCFFIVPNNFYYEILNSENSPTTVAWSEFQLTTGSVSYSGDLLSQALSTVYHNTSGFAKWVVVCAALVAQTGMTAVSDASATPSAVVSAGMNSNVTNGTATVSFLVPNGHYYEVTPSSGGTLSHWNEYTMPFNVTKSANLASTTYALPVNGRLLGTSDFGSNSAGPLVTFPSPLYSNSTGSDVYVQVVIDTATINTTIIAGAGNAAVSNSIFMQATEYTNTNNLPFTAYALTQPFDYYWAWQSAGSTALTLANWWEYQIG